jgi:hypothetical protein
MALDIEALKKAAQAAERVLPTEIAWYGKRSLASKPVTLESDLEFITRASPGAILELIALAEKQIQAECGVTDAMLAQAPDKFGGVDIDVAHRKA